MAKPLTSPQPSSSIANLLESGVAAAALRPVPNGQPESSHAGMRVVPHSGRPVPTGEPAHLKREFVLTETADETLNQLLRVFSKGTGSRLTNSHVVRAILHAVQHALPDVAKQAERLGPLRRPSNARGNEAERDELERKLAACLVAGMRACPLMEP
jgi:hypothetical protein